MLTHIKDHNDAEGSTEAKRKAIVIGSGFGGLATAVRLCAKGYQVDVVEKLDGPGGRAYVIKQDGFVFDTGPTIITAPWLLDELWELCGKKVSDDIDLRELTPFYDVRFDDGSVFTLSRDKEDMRRQITEISPEDVDNFDRFMARSKEIYKYGFEDLANVSFDSLKPMLKAAPHIIALGGLRTVFGQVSKFIRHPKLRIALSLHPLLIGGNPYSVTSIYCLINYLESNWGVHFAMGGTGKLVEGLVGLIEMQGGKMHYSSEVNRINVADGRASGVTLRDGTVMDADIVVSNADAAWTYDKMLPDVKRKKRWTPRRIKNTRYSMGLFVWYFGTNRQFTDVPHHSMVLGPRFKGLLKDIFTHKRLSDDFSMYLHRPTATDPSMAPKGCDTFYALVPVPHLDANVDWTTEGEKLRDRVEKRLEETVLPGLGDTIVTSTFVTPKDFETRLNSFKGAGFGPEPVIWQSAFFRPHNRSEEVDGLYMVGASTHPGAGIPGVITSARVVSERIPHARELV